MWDTARAEVWHGLLFGQRSMLLRLAGELKQEYGLTLAQFEALQVLAGAREEPLTASGLGAALLYSSGSTTNLLKRMEQLGLVQRGQCPRDARVVRISLTAQGADLIGRAAASHQAAIAAQFFPLLPDDELAAVEAFTRRLIAHEDLEALPHFPSHEPPRNGDPS